ncbi:UNVERIFIED_CONTAM: hypothetical protein K2H54_065345 [Gekko kuhli]
METRDWQEMCGSQQMMPKKTYGWEERICIQMGKRSLNVWLQQGRRRQTTHLKGEIIPVFYKGMTFFDKTYAKETTGMSAI